MLDLVQDDETLQRAQRQIGLGQPRQVGRVLEVEIGRDIVAPGDQLPCQRRLADLPGADQADDREGPEEVLDALEVVLTPQHEISVFHAEISCFEVACGP